MRQTISILVSGKVQGVFFRQATREKAMELGLTGFVQNLPDGSVYILATGTKPQLDMLTAWCGSGPPRAVVARVQSAAQDLQEFDSFFIRRS